MMKEMNPCLLPNSPQPFFNSPNTIRLISFRHPAPLSPHQNPTRKPKWKISCSFNPANSSSKSLSTPRKPNWKITCSFNSDSFPSNLPSPQATTAKSRWEISCSFNSNNFPSKSPSPQTNSRKLDWKIMSAAEAEVEMVKNSDGVWTAKQKKVVLLWDLDNKPPRGPPYHAAISLREVAQRFGQVVDMSAYANRHAFTQLPQWVLDDRRERRRTDVLERKGLAVAPDPYVCGVCGRKCRTRLDLRKHFRQLHERERQKKLNRMRSLKGKRRQRYKERFISGNRKYEEAERELLTPRVGYGLASELRRAGVFVKTVEDKPQAADWALKRQMQHSMARGVDWLFLVSDDSDFSQMLCHAREANMRTVVVGDDGRWALGRHADIWIPWIQVENGEVGDEILQSASRMVQFDRKSEEEEEDGFFSLTHSDFDDDEEDDESDLDSVVDEIEITGSGFNRIKISAFSEEEFCWDDNGDEGDAEGYY